jgi:hypothetical protein
VRGFGIRTGTFRENGCLVCARVLCVCVCVSCVCVLVVRVCVRVCMMNANLVATGAIVRPQLEEEIDGVLRIELLKHIVNAVHDAGHHCLHIIGADSLAQQSLPVEAVAEKICVELALDARRDVLKDVSRRKKWEGARCLR